MSLQCIARDTLIKLAGTRRRFNHPPSQPSLRTTRETLLEISEGGTDQAKMGWQVQRPLASVV